MKLVRFNKVPHVDVNPHRLQDGKAIVTVRIMEGGKVVTLVDDAYRLRDLLDEAIAKLERR